MNQFTFLKFQKDWIYDNSRLKILEKSRRIGGTFSTSFKVFLDLMYKKGHDIVVISRDEETAVEFVENVSAWFKMWNAMNPNDQIPEKNFKRLKLEVPHKSGRSRLIAVSSNPDASAGKGGSLIIDEMALHRDPELLMRVAQPIISMSGGNLAVLSTHRSRNSKFNELVTDAKKEGSPWTHHRTTIYDAVDQGLVEIIVNPNMIKNGHEPYSSGQAFIDWLKSTYDEHTFLQEFCCVPSDEACSLLSSIEMDQAKARYKSEKSLDKGQTYLGYDCAVSIDGDYAALCVIKAFKQDVELLEPYYFPKGTPIEKQINTVVSYAKQYKVHKVVSDNNGIGNHPTTIIQNKLGESRVIAFDPTMQSKNAMCTKVKRYFQNKNVRMIENKMVEDDFLSIDRVVTPSNNVIYQAVRRNGSHGDMFSAFAMAMTEVPENQSAEIKGVSNPIDPYDEIVTPEQVLTSKQRIELNRQLDEDRASSFTY
jgi:phage FluMu gp28-like protein